MVVGGAVGQGVFPPLVAPEIGVPGLGPIYAPWHRFLTRGVGRGTIQRVTRDTRTTDDLAEAFLTASRVLVGLAVQSLAAAPVDITLAQHRVLVLLASGGELQIGDIATELRINPSNATRHCDRLQKLGLLARRRSVADGRVVQVELTEAGRKVVAAVSEARRHEISRVLEDMPADHRAAVLAALESFAEAAHERADRDWVTHVW